MTALIAQIATWLFLMGLLGLVLGWWLGRNSASSRMAKAQEDWQQRLSTAELDAERLRADGRDLATQLEEARADLERAQERSRQVVANLNESERLLLEERQRSDEESGELRAQLGVLQEELDRRGTEHSDLEKAAADLAAGRDRIAELEAAVARSRHKLAEIERSKTPSADVAALRAENRQLRKVKADFQEWILGEARREGELDHARRQLAEALTEREAHAAEAAALRSGFAREQARVTELEAASGEIEQLRADLAHRDARVSDLEAHIASKAGLEEELQQLRGELESSEARSRAMEERARLAEERAEAALRNADGAGGAAGPAETQLIDMAELQTAEPDPREAAGSPESLETRVIELAELSPASSKLADVDEADGADEAPGPDLLPDPPDDADDLKRIRGIGRVFEQTLNELGIYRYRQVAAWSESDVDWVASHLDTFSDRIERDGWIEQASQLESERVADES